VQKEAKESQKPMRKFTRDIRTILKKYDSKQTTRDNQHMVSHQIRPRSRSKSVGGVSSLGLMSVSKLSASGRLRTQSEIELQHDFLNNVHYAPAALEEITEDADLLHEFTGKYRQRKLQPNDPFYTPPWELEGVRTYRCIALDEVVAVAMQQQVNDRMYGIRVSTLFLQRKALPHFLCDVFQFKGSWSTWRYIP
jgi:hypothetical protein